MALYLLGDLAEEERDHLEERLLADEEAFSRLEVVEEDLIDAYVKGELSGAEKQSFKSRFLATPERRGRVAFRRALETQLASETPAEMRPRNKNGNPRALRLAVAANILMALGVGWLVAQTMNLRGQVEELASQRAQALEERESLNGRTEALSLRLADREARAEELGQILKEQVKELSRNGEEIASLQGSLATSRSAAEQRRSQPLVASVLLSMGVRSRGGSPLLRLPRVVDWAELQVDLDGDDGYDDFRVILRTTSGAQVWSRKGLAATVTEWGSELRLRLPGRLLTRGGYELAVEGLAASGDVLPVGFYDFRVEH